MKFYINNGDLEEIKSVVNGERDLCTVNPWQDPSRHSSIEVTMQYKVVKKYKVSFLKRLKRALNAFRRELKK